MNFNTLSSNEKLGVYGAIAVIVGMLIASTGFFGFGLGTLALLAAIAMLIVIFLPQMSQGSTMPGSKGTLMLACGIIAAAVLVIALIGVLGYIGLFLGNINGIFFLIAVVGSLAMAWAGWQELQSEGGSMRFGGAGSPASGGVARNDASTVSTAPAAPPPSSTPPHATPPSTTPAASSWSDTSQPAAGSGGSGGGGSEGAPSSGSGMGSGGSSGMGSSAPASSGTGSEPGSEGGSSGQRDDEGPPRNP